MVVFNYSGAELNAKVVYYGPALSGKTTNLEFIYERMPEDTKGKMVSMKTRTDRTLFFDFLPLDVGEINGYRTRILLYTVPGQVYYNATRKLVLKGADAVVFVADSQASKMEENIESLRNLEENLNEHSLTLDTMPWVIQYNKRDLPGALPVAMLNSKLNLLNVPSYEAVATTGHGIYETFRAIGGLLYRQLVERLKSTQPAPRVGAGVEGSPQESQTEAPPTPQTPEPQPVAAHGPMPHVTEPQPTAAQTTRSQPTAAQTTEPQPTAAQTTRSQPTAAQTTQSQPWASQPAGPKPPAVSDDVSDVVDSALREVEENNVPGPDTPRVVTSAPSKPGKIETAPPMAQTPLGEANAGTEKKMDDSLDKEFQFASLESSREVDEDVGRVIDFDDTPVELPTDSQGGEFIVDPFQSKTAETEEPEPKEATSPPPRTASPPPGHPSPVASQDDEPVTVTVPVYLKRSQMRKTVPIKIELEIQVGDEEA